jgi:hypothetical protein
VSVPDGVMARIVSAVPGGVLATTDTDQVFPEPQIAVFDAIIPKNPPSRYLVVYMGSGTLDALAACGASNSATVRYQINAVAPDRAMAAWLAEKARDNTVDTKPTADGWSCGPVRHVYGLPPQRDETVAERPVVFLIDQYELLATRV